MSTAEIGFNKERTGTGGHGALHLLNAVLLATMWGLTFLLYPELPERIPGHIGPGGVTRWEPKQSGMWFVMPILGTGQVLLMYALSGLASGSPQGINTPQKKRLLALPREGQRYAMQPLRPFMYGMAAWLLVLFTFVQLSFYRVAVQAQTGEPSGTPLIAGTLLLTLVPIAMTVWLSRAMGRRIEEWEARADGGSQGEAPR